MLRVLYCLPPVVPINKVSYLGQVHEVLYARY
jgi:hypothetical protein